MSSHFCPQEEVEAEMTSSAQGQAIHQVVGSTLPPCVAPFEEHGQQMTDEEVNEYLENLEGLL